MSSGQTTPFHGYNSDLETPNETIVQQDPEDSSPVEPEPEKRPVVTRSRAGSAGTTLLTGLQPLQRRRRLDARSSSTSTPVPNDEIAADFPSTTSIVTTESLEWEDTYADFALYRNQKPRGDKFSTSTIFSGPLSADIYQSSFLEDEHGAGRPRFDILSSSESEFGDAREDDLSITEDEEEPNGGTPQPNLAHEEVIRKLRANVKASVEVYKDDYKDMDLSAVTAEYLQNKVKFADRVKGTLTESLAQLSEFAPEDYNTLKDVALEAKAFFVNFIKEGQKILRDQENQGTT